MRGDSGRTAGKACGRLSHFIIQASAFRRSHSMQMPLSPTWTDIAVRLALAMIAGALLGFNRGARGHAAGLRTTILVTLAAAAAMIQCNILLPLDGKQPGSFAVMDLMRLPLGILTGVGFGGGAILKKGGSITGVTTAATLWIATVIGLCLGGGQLGLGIASTALGLFTLWGMQWIDLRIPREHSAMLVVATEPGSPTPRLEGLLGEARRARLRRQNLALNSRNEEEIETHFEIVWRQAESAAPRLDFIAPVEQVCRVKSIEITSERDRPGA
jgi:putative Mg2+ transporter-C (MgtC) family protein